MAIVNLYFSVKPSMNYTFKEGSVAHFVNGQYYTANEKFAQELDELVAGGNPFIFTKPDQLKIDSKMLDPIEALKAKIREELLAEMKAGPVQQDLGTVAKPDVMAGAATTQTLAAISGGTVKVTAPKINK